MVLRNRACSTICHFETTFRVSTGGQHVEVLSVNADNIGSTCHGFALGWTGGPPAINTTTEPRSSGRDRKPRRSSADAQREIESHRGSKGKTEAHFAGSGSTIEGTPGRTHEGTGIGLALVVELVRLHGGTVQVESRVGEGTAFTVKIPLGTDHLPPDRIAAEGLIPPTTIGAAPFVQEAMR